MKNSAHSANTEISTRHLPDVSDASTTFQIPAASETRLLDENSRFLDGFDDSLATPVSFHTNKELLTVSQLTLHRKLATDLEDAISSTVGRAPQPQLFSKKALSPSRAGNHATSTSWVQAQPSQARLTDVDARSPIRYEEVDELVRCTGFTYPLQAPPIQGNTGRLKIVEVSSYVVIFTANDAKSVTVAHAAPQI